MCLLRNRCFFLWCSNAGYLSNKNEVTKYPPRVERRQKAAVDDILCHRLLGLRPQLYCDGSNGHGAGCCSRSARGLLALSRCPRRSALVRAGSVRRRSPTPAPEQQRGSDTQARCGAERWASSRCSPKSGCLSPGKRLDTCQWFYLVLFWQSLGRKRSPARIAFGKN